MLQIVYTPKNPYFIQSAQKLSTQKIQELKISNPIKSFNHPRHLKCGVPPPPPPLGINVTLLTLVVLSWGCSAY